MPTTTASKGGNFCPKKTTAGVDWLTFIADDRNESEELLEVMDGIVKREIQRGEKVTPFRFMRWRGVKVGAARFGRYEDTAVAQLSGELCNSTWKSLAPLSGRTTRLDLQTTIELPESRPDFARSLMRRSGARRASQARKKRRLSYSSDTSGLCIGTVGPRTNREYLRVYDKGVEADTHSAGILWRIELEAKRDLAPMLWNSLKDAPNVPTRCYAACASSWKRAGLRWRLPKPSEDFTVPAAEPWEPPGAAALAAWLRTSVRPAIPRVLAVYEVSEVLEMLGLADLATVRPPRDDHADR